MADSFSVSTAALEAFRGLSARIISETTARALAKSEDVAQHGADAPRLIASGIQFTVRMLDAAMASGEDALLEDELHWALDRLPNDGVSAEQILSRFAMMREVVNGCIPPGPAAEVVAAVRWMERRLRELAARRTG